MTPQKYIISLLLGGEGNSQCESVYYGKLDSVISEKTKVIIVQSDFFDKDIYGTDKSLPRTPFERLPETDTPFLFGNSLLEQDVVGRFVLYADIIASAYFMLSRYEEIIKPECRDQYGRFLAKDSIIFQQGFGFRPLVDEWGLYLRQLLRKAGVIIPQEKKGLKKIYLTHDVDRPFYFTIKIAFRQFIKNIIHYGKYIPKPIISYLLNNGDPFYTFPWIINVDNDLRNLMGNNKVKSIYFIICGKNSKKNSHYKYASVRHWKYKKLLALLSNNDAEIGLHISHEGGIEPERIKNEIRNLPKYANKVKIKSRHHYLRWREPGHIKYMQEAGVQEDFSLEYPDSVGFRVGTSSPYRFINPDTQTVTNVIIHPMQIMECSLCDKGYMGLSEEEAYSVCKNIINETVNYNGELVLLFHNSAFVENKIYENLYIKILDYLKINN